MTTNAFDYDDASWRVIEKFFSINKGYQLVKHQIESYNDFILRKLDQIIDGFNPIEVNYMYVPEIEKFRYSLCIEVSNPILNKPIIVEKDGSTKIMTPNDARQRNFTYASNLMVDILIIAKSLNDETGEYVEEKKEIKNVPLGKIPIMVKSNYCVLKSIMTQNDQECRYEYGGYFIVNGNEKVVISQDRISENKTFVFVNNKVSIYSHVAEIRSIQENKLGVPKITSIKLSNKSNQFGRHIRANIHHIKTDIPVFILFKALGLSNDKEIIEYIVYDLEDKVSISIINELAACIEEASSIKCQKDALEYLAKYLNITGYSKEVLYNKNQRINIVRNVLEREFLPHVGKDYHKKALYLGFMVNKLLKCFLRLKEFDDRDSYINKRVDTPGVLMANLFRQYYGKVVKDLKNLLQKEINNGGWKATNKFINVVNKINVTKLFKSTVIDSGMRYALATGNWGIKNNKTKIGVAQVLNRMTYSSTLSHLRRINTPIEKSGKLIMPRKLHNTQWGVICPCETPEGSSVGLVKNMALMASITISSNSVNVKEIIVSLGTIEFTPGVLKQYAKMTKVIVNGAIFGFHETPNYLYNELKIMKRRGYINVYTGIVWNIYDNEIAVCTEGGRCVRPLFIVNDGRLVFEKYKDETSWNKLIRGNDNDEQSSVIEFLDVEEVNMSMVAMKYNDLRIGENGGLLPIKYTHLEIHPISILGVAAANIPFSDHNQAPRNCYQCLWEEELVLMADNTQKPIKDVQIGDRVMTFDTITMEVSTTKVIHQFVKVTDKKMFRVTTLSGRTIIATYDHLFMTENGWMEVQHLSYGTNVAIYGTTIDDEYLKHLQYPGSKRIPFYLWKSQVSSMSSTVFVPVESILEVSNCMIADITVESDNHSFIAGDSFQVHNSSMSKQAIGIYASNYRHRFDTLAHVLNYGQKPLVRTKMAKILNSDTLPNGINAIVAIMTYTGYNQEDSVILNQSAIDRGLFTSTYYRTYKEQNNKNHSNGEEEFFTKPENTGAKGSKPFNYDKIDKDGFVPENMFVKSGDIIIGKCMPNKVGSVITYKDNSISMKNNEKGFVDKNCYNDNYFKTVNGDGYSFCKVRIRSERVPVIGDKLASRAAQKGTIGMTYRQEDMPFSGSGIVPDIIMNPNAIPSRMTIGQLMETLLGKACAVVGNCGDSTPFTDLNVETIAKVLEEAGIEKYGNEVMYDPRTGQQMQCDIFIGPTFYQRLKHMTTDKIHSRGSSGPIILLTRQPAEGRARDGGLRMGEMEIECNWAHGVNMFLKERIMECSDNYRMHVCKQCGYMAVANPEKNVWSCLNCQNITNFAEIRVPYAFKLLLQEIQSMSLGTKFITS